ncbi:MAG: metal-dependent hydrolase [Mongoliibacter sp.]|jgi:L-ascorbate metabolism protein UlaG (beta-lactamase superfamily)|uniref:metal-dependent hydrolase n=1 Tax=Mongoliibacter sp. TaxID=2022438 RepID=UPI0012F00415|nr:metal-dependent hydrolase [Mongoliibacter sp.]TVP42925.1 MAG: metal-dependent hydrolase [Mongoliibacter sp.]
MIEITYYGHSAFLVKVGGKSIIFDPFISPNEKASQIDVSSLKADYVLISHGHEDHVADAEAITKSSDAMLVANYEVAVWFAEKGVEKYHPMNHGGSKKFDFGSVKYVNAIHSSTLPDGSSGGNPGGFVIQHEDGCFYYAGDTALTYDMKLIAEEFKVDFAFMPIGDNFTMGIEDAIKAADFVGTKKIIGMHYDTFPYIEINLEDAKKAAAKAGKELILLNIGESIKI